MIGQKTNLAIIISLVLLATFAGAVDAMAQGGGKAMPNRIAFSKGKSSNTVYGSLKSGEIAEFVFGVSEGQKVNLRVSSYSPAGKFHAFSILGHDDIDFATEFDENYEYEFIAPETGDYGVDVRFRPTDAVRSGKFKLTLTITNTGEM